MPSQALETFNAAVDASALSESAKTTAKAWGKRLYLAGIKEAGEHMRRHVLDECAARPASGELTARRNLIVTVLDRVKNADDNLALSIADAL